MLLHLFCLIDGDSSVEHAFPFKIPNTETVRDLKIAIKAINSIAFANIDAVMLTLWKVNIPYEDEDRFKHLDFEDNKSDSIERLIALKMLEKYFPEDPAKEHIHIIVKQPHSKY